MVAIAVAAIILLAFAVVLFFFLKGKGNKEVEEEEETPILTKTQRGCPKEVKEEIKKEYQQLLSQATELYQKLLAVDKTIPEEVAKDYSNFLRIYNVIRDMKEEIELYPQGNCREYFKEKINFYRKLMGELFEKIKEKLNS